MTPEDEEFNRIERESRIKQEYVRDIINKEATMRKPVGLTAPYRADDDDDIQTYKKPWVDLTDSEIVELAQDHLNNDYEFARAVEKRLKEKNA